MGKVKYSQKIKKQIVDDYINGKSTLKIKEEYGISPNTTLRLVRNAGYIPRTNKENSRKYFCNEDYFEIIDTEHKAYWLGFIYADGYISTSNKYNQEKFGMSLAFKDKYILEELNKDLSSNYPIYDYKTTASSYKEGTDYSRLLITSSKLVNDLIRHGVFANKSKILKAPNTIPDNLKHHFIRGYLDGDGCISKCNRKTRIEYSIKILGTECFLNYIKEYIHQNRIATINKYFKRKQDLDVLSLEFSGNKQVLNFLHLIYKDATIALNRKYERYKELCTLYTVEPNGNIGC